MMLKSNDILEKVNSVLHEHEVKQHLRDIESMYESVMCTLGSFFEVVFSI